MKSSVRIVALAGMLAVAACGDDGVSPGNLSEEEAQELATAIFSQSLFDALSMNYQQPAQAPGGRGQSAPAPATQPGGGGGGQRRVRHGHMSYPCNPGAARVARR